MELAVILSLTGVGTSWLFTLATIAYGYGRLSAKVDTGFKEVNRRLDISNGTLKEHSTQLNEHTRKISYIEGFVERE